MSYYDLQYILLALMDSVYAGTGHHFSNLPDINISNSGMPGCQRESVIILNVAGTYCAPAYNIQNCGCVSLALGMREQCVVLEAGSDYLVEAACCA